MTQVTQVCLMVNADPSVPSIVAGVSDMKKQRRSVAATRVASLTTSLTRSSSKIPIENELL